jgi:hypothetical protein
MIAALAIGPESRARTRLVANETWRTNRFQDFDMFALLCGLNFHQPNRTSLRQQGGEAPHRQDADTEQPAIHLPREERRVRPPAALCGSEPEQSLSRVTLLATTELDH